MEDALVQIMPIGINVPESLNPCFNGRCTSTLYVVLIVGNITLQS